MIFTARFHRLFRTSCLALGRCLATFFLLGLSSAFAANTPPTDISLSKSNLPEGNFPGTVVGRLTYKDPGGSPYWSDNISLVAGEGDADNGAFEVANMTLTLKGAADYELQSSYSIRLSVADYGSPPMTYEEMFTITVTDIVDEAALVVAQQAFLKATYPVLSDFLGASVAISGNTVVVGAPQILQSGRIGSGPILGGAYVFVNNAGVWTQEARLISNNLRDYDRFGESVAISGDTIVVGAPQENSRSTGVNSTPIAYAGNAGAAYVFVRQNGVWTQQAYLKANVVKSDGYFGQSVAVFGDTVAVGVPGDDRRTLEMGPPMNNFPNSGAVYIFKRDASSNWTCQSYLKPVPLMHYAEFGSSVALSKDTLVVGSPAEYYGANGTLDDYSSRSGAAHVFIRSGEAWTQQAYLKASNVGDGYVFGSSVAVSGDMVVIGAPGEASNTSGVNSTPNGLSTSAGAAYVFARHGSDWAQEAYLKASNSQSGDQFGHSVSISGDSVVVGSPYEDSSTTWVNSVPDEAFSGAGAAYVFKRSQGDWAQQAYLKYHNPGVSHLFGYAVAVDGDTLVSGAPQQYMEPETQYAGAAYVFKLPPFTEISVAGNGMEITSGVAEPALADGTDFGSVSMTNGNVVRTFTIRNTGTTTLALGDVMASGAHASDFTIITQPPSIVPAAESVSFQVSFDPSGLGTRGALLNLTNNDSDESPYTFAVSGVGSLPRVEVVEPQILQTITFTPPGTLYLNQGPATLSAFSSSGLPVAFGVAGPATLDGNVLTLTGAGTVKITATQPGNDHCKAAPAVTRSITVKPVPSKPTLADLNQIYDGTPRAARVLVQSGDESTPITYLVNKVLTTAPPTSAGTYPVSVGVNGQKISGNLVIAKAPLWVMPASFTRFIGQANPVLTATYEGFISGDTETAVFASAGAKRPVLSTTAKAASPGGVYPIKATGAVLANYVPVYQSGRLTVQTFAGGYEAMLVDNGDQPAAKVEFTVATSSATLSGKLTVPGEPATLSFTGTLSVNASAETATGTSKPIVKGEKTYVLNFTLPFEEDFSSELRINDGLSADTVEGEKISTSSSLLQAGTHTMILAPAELAGTGVPAGSGHAVVTMDAKAVLKLAGRLADGTTLTATLMPDSAAGYRLFTQPYARVGSYLAGWLDLQAHPHLPLRIYVPAGMGTDLVWKKVGLPADKSYRQGFGPVVTRVTLDPWLPPSKTVTLASLLGLPADGSFAVAHHGFASVSLTQMPSELNLDAANKITVTAPVTEPLNATKWKATITPATGLFSGSLELLDNGKKRSVPFAGVLRQPHGTGAQGAVGAGQLLVPALPTDPTSEVISGGIRFDP
ncbi:MAG: choice-of-anchor D domain-containing protein [Verrucomicrobiota bacterium]